ncbi:MAG: hypothetical protein AAFR77_08635 [Cyanobacteria bacterium J06631_2]
MNRLPRRTARVQPPLRGRLATSLSPQQQQDYSLPVVRSRPGIPRQPKGIIISQEQDGLAQDLWTQDLELAQPSEATSSSEEAIAESNPLPVTPDISKPESQAKLLQWLIGIIVLLTLLLLGGNLS